MLNADILQNKSEDDASVTALVSRTSFSSKRKSEDCDLIS